MTDEQLLKRQEEVFNSIKLSRVILPIVLGIGIVIYLFLKQFDKEAFATIDWNIHVLLWVLGSLFFLALRHFAYMVRLYILTDGFFSLRKCFELIFVWEFSTAISPTSVGGAAAALVFLSNERLATSKTAAIVVYTIVLDAGFFLVTSPFLFLIFGKTMISAGAEWGDSNSTIFLSVYLLMLTYCSFFIYGLFFKPHKFKQLLVFVSRIPFLKRFRERWERLGDEVAIASREVKAQDWKYHAGVVLTTMIAWSSRFILLNCLIIAFVAALDSDFMTHFFIFARLESMYVIILLAPTPGGVGFVEYLFGQFLGDIITTSTFSLVIVLFWRTFTYYFYLLAGAIVIPNWIRKILNKRKLEKLEAEQS